MELREKDLHKHIVKFLKTLQKMHNFIFFHVKNDVGRRENHFFFDLHSLGVLPGVSDFCILKPGETIFLEIKTKSGRLSKNQKNFLDQIKALGHKGFVSYGWKESHDTILTILGVK